MGAYVVAIFAIVLSATSALTLFFTISHLDGRQINASEADRTVGV